jgi:hypothetical protein
MARRAIRDTFAMEPITAEVEVRRFVKAGSVLPPHYVGFPDEDVQDDGQRYPVVMGETAPRVEGEATGTRRARK